MKRKKKIFPTREAYRAWLEACEPASESSGRMRPGSTPSSPGGRSRQDGAARSSQALILDITAGAISAGIVPTSLRSRVSGAFGLSY